MNKKSLQKVPFALYNGGIIRNVEIVKYFTKIHMRIEQENPSHNSYEKPITRPEGDALLNDASGEEFTGPVLQRHELLMSQGDINLDVATQLEEIYGIDIAAPHYEKAMQDYLSALFVRGAYAPEPNYAFWLKLGGTQARVASWKGLAPYSSNLRPSHGRGKSRREDLFMSAEDCYEEALQVAGGTDASLEVKARIALELTNMYAIQAEFRGNNGSTHDARLDLINAKAAIDDAKNIIDHATEAEVDPNLAQKIDEQAVIVGEVMNGKIATTEIHLIAAESLRELVAIA